MPSTGAVAAAARLARRPRLVVVGTGWAGFRFVRDVLRSAYDVVVISPRDHFVFTPLLASTTIGSLEFRAIIEPVRIVGDLRFYEAEVTGVDPAEKTVRCVDSTRVFDNEEQSRSFTVPYDYLVLAAGAKSQTFGVPGVYEHAMFLKNIADARRIRQRIMHCLQRACQPQVGDEERRELLSLMAGCHVYRGPTSVEFAAELYDFVTEDVGRWYGRDIVDSIRITVLEAGRTILGSFDRALSEYTVRLFQARDIEVRTGVAVKQVTKRGVELGDGSVVPSNLVVWSTGVAAIPLIQSLNWEHDKRSGRLLVSEYLSVPSAPGVYALGDCAVNEKEPLPCTAQVAQQQAKYLARVFNQYNSVGGPPVGSQETTKTKPFVYRHLASLAYVGGWKSIADSKVVKSSGLGTWLFWRSAYWTTNVSIRNKILIPMYWFKAWLFGRDISTF
ncbi:FAD/NAD(P)-binding domain-containing protein [Plasmodiophora brassicae]